ncbi:hypothetical protein CW298_0712 [Salmonella enterica subsp. enterica serovar Muenchen]|nr:hypothetical protein CW298_0712 [Salmonella enterica subsp. enterica serovar Muenchen]
MAGNCEEVRAVVAAADRLRRPAFQHPGSGYGADRAGKPAGSSRRRAAGGDCREAQLHAGRARHQGSISAGAAVGAGPDGKSGGGHGLHAGGAGAVL